MNDMPPVELQPRADQTALFRPGFAENIHLRLSKLRRQCPVANVQAPDNDPIWLVLDHADVSSCLRDPRLSVQREGPPDRAKAKSPMAISLMNYEPPEHTRIRRLATAAFTERSVARYRPVAGEIAAELLDGLTGTLDLMTAFAQPFPLAVLGEVFGIPRADQAMLFEWVSGLFNRRSGDEEAAEAAITNIEAYLGEQLKHRRRHPTDDALSLIQQAWQADGGVAEDELLSLCGMLLLAGSNSTAQMIGICAVGLMTHRDLRTRLHEDPSMVPAAVQELLRWDTPGPFSTPRWAKADIDLAGTTIPAGSRVILSFLGANRDPRCHPRPDELDLDRPKEARNLAFGLGSHFCPGRSLAVLELEVAVSELNRRFPELTLAIPACELHWSGRHQQRRLESLPVTV